ncbi:polysaccharide deacetylase family protein [Neomoorella mulderi]|uniref:Peptidoglycan-N-acetylmuramic acid deacetylase PdaC n=1 Tax=Moorella mulderi DSM 14980 TaxID=1122241 RepID=A0A151AYH7_9FIRM|nr:polysaccharide deacetylase family protein [Moorella mulderi]KYH32705.1 peptidoglycan-N-acetylmuramic acid deacetylase PdaC [Moorella mulderi DSM 14980]
MSQAGKYVVGHWPWVARIGKHPRAAWPEALLRLGHLVTIAALMVVVTTIGGAGWQQAGVTGPALASPPVTGPYQLAGGKPGLSITPVKPVAVAPITPPRPAPPVPEPEPKPVLQPLRQVPGAGHRVALTFDDGPFPRWTERYLTVLAATRTPATFFMVGRQVEAHPELVRAALDGGHEVASHSWRHANLGKASQAEAEADLRQAAAVLEKISGRPVKYFRPPYGAMGPNLLVAAARLGTPIVTWSVDPKDWSNPGPRAIVLRVMANVRDGSIILLHEGHPGTLVALPLLIKELRGKGYELVTVSELIASGEQK